MSVSQNGMTWRIANGSAPPEAARSMGRPAATNSGEGRNLYVAWRDTSEDRITVTRYAANDSWSVVSSVQARNAPYAPGIAYADDRHLLLAYQRHSAGLSSRDMYPVVRASSNSGATWTSEFVLDGLSYISGISATHDPASGEWLLFTGGPSVEGRGNESGIFLCGTAISRTTCRNPG